MEALETAVENNNVQGVYAALQELKEQHEGNYYIKNCSICKALEHGNGYLVAALLAAKNLQSAPFHGQNEDLERESNPLYWAIVDQESLELTKMLFDAGYEPFPAEQETALHLAANTNNTALLEYIWELGQRRNFSVNTGDELLWTPLHHAVRYLRPVAAQFLLQRGANVNALDRDGYNALSCLGIAGNRNDPERGHDVRSITQLCINAGLQLEQLTPSRYIPSDEMTPLMHAALRGTSAAVKALLGAGANVGTRSTQQRTALHYASIGRSLECMRLLLAAGADVKARDIDGNIPLHAACNHRSNGEGRIKPVLLELINHGADVNAKNNAGKTPLHVACENICNDGASTLNALLFELGGNVSLLAPGKESCLHLVLKSVCDECPSSLPWTDLRLEKTKGSAAAALGYVHTLLSAGARAEAINVEGFKPLELIKERLGAAVLNEHKDIFAPLIVALIKGGDFYSWGSVPKGCLGLETAMEAVWANRPEMLSQLFAKLGSFEQGSVKMALRCLQRYFPSEKVRVLILSKSGTV